ncbi:activator of HSP90 ATPase [Actinomadura rubrobrunea]|uniref:Activator of HSP90 ATPase n=1 Tax=Actinomadura rubrobrunea TaxID=115335 RepID=A0A9W6PYW7_9ACTN|nr:SRPBCC domain-containing protein [Actinomadura rubrobrunea]GLW66397.1 activator of HSP90 ATPase [Actinomadura rubrobrunea]
MSVTRVDKDFDTLTLTVVAEFDAPVERVWRLWDDPRRLERWWGPPEFPTTVEEHDLTPGGTVTYVMTGPDGQKSRGWWRVTSVEPPTSLEFIDGFADQDGAPVPDMPTSTVRVRLTEHDGRTRMEVRSIFDSREHMENLVRMGAVDVFAQSIDRMDALLAD